MNRNYFFEKNCFTQELDEREILIYMNPTDFLSVAMSGHSKEKSNSVRLLHKDNVLFNDLPFLNFVHDGEGTANVTGHEGRHRAKLLAELGITQMPVLLRHRYDLNGQPIIWKKMELSDNQFMDEWPEKLYGERGSSEATNKNYKNFIPFPVSDLRFSNKSKLKI